MILTKVLKVPKKCAKTIFLDFLQTHQEQKVKDRELSKKNG